MTGRHSFFLTRRGRTPISRAAGKPLLARRRSDNAELGRVFPAGVLPGRETAGK